MPYGFVCPTVQHLPKGILNKTFYLFISLGLPLCNEGLRHCKAVWHDCVGFRYVVWQRWEAGKMRNSEMEQDGDLEQCSKGKLEAVSPFVEDLVIFFLILI